MSFRPDHELHKRRTGRNMGVGLVLIVFVGLIYGLTVVKARQNNSALPQSVEVSE